MKMQSLASQRERLCRLMTSFVSACDGRTLEDRQVEAAARIRCNRKTVQNAMRAPVERESWSKFVARFDWMMGTRNLADFCCAAEVSASYILTGVPPERLGVASATSWIDDLCAWLAERLELTANRGLDGERIRAFVLEAVRAAEAHDASVFERVIPISETARELLAHGIGDKHERARWRSYLEAADAEVNRAPSLQILHPPRWTKARNADPAAPALQVSNIDLLPIPQLRLSIVPPLTHTEPGAKRRKRTK